MEGDAWHKAMLTGRSQPPAKSHASLVENSPQESAAFPLGMLILPCMLSILSILGILGPLGLPGRYAPGGRAQPSQANSRGP